MDDIEDDDLKRLAAQDGVTAAFSDIFNPFITVQALKKRISTTLLDHTRVDYWIDQINDYVREHRDIDMASKFPFFHDIEKEVLVGVNWTKNQSDAVSQYAQMDYERRQFKSFDDYNPKIFIKPILEHNGRLIHIWGNPGSGKTDFALLLTESAIANGFVVLTNIFVKRANFIRFDEVEDGEDKIDGLYRSVRLSDMLYHMIKLREENKSVVIVWDEVSLFYHRQKAATQKNIDLGILLRLIRKFSANIIFLEQIDEGLATVAIEMLTSKFYKMSPKLVQYSTRDLEKNYNLFLKSVPPTHIDFDTYDFAGFRMDVNLSYMFNKIDIDDEDKADEIKKHIYKIMMDNKKKIITKKSIEHKSDEHMKMMRDKRKMTIDKLKRDERGRLLPAKA